MASAGPETVTDWRGVDRADLERAADLGQELARRRAAERQRRHAPDTAGPLLVAAAGDDDPRRVVERQRAGAQAARDFADAVADMTGRLDADVAQYRDDADLDREE